MMEECKCGTCAGQKEGEAAENIIRCTLCGGHDSLCVDMPAGTAPERPGSRLPRGGEPGQYLAMTEEGPAWADLPETGSALPPGGQAGQVLVKGSDQDGDVVWATPVTQEDMTGAIDAAVNGAIKEEY